MEKINLKEFKELAYRAYYWTSFDPEKRAKDTILEHEDQLNEDLSIIPEEEKERYITNYKKYFSEWLYAHSNCASSAITGSSGFNVRRAEKSNYREHAKFEQFIEWREKALKAIARKIEESKPEEQKRDEAWNALKMDILDSATVIDGINKGVKKRYSKALFVSNIYGKVETFAKHGETEIVNKAIDCIRNFNETNSVIITERHKFFKLGELAELNKEKLSNNSEKENTSISFKGGKMVNNFKENRLQLSFDEKPSSELISQLKKHAFRWSPKFCAWQRQLTNNATYDAYYFLRNNEMID